MIVKVKDIKEPLEAIEEEILEEVVEKEDFKSLNLKN